MADGASLKLGGPFFDAVKKLRAANKKIMPGQIGRAILLEWLRKIILRWPVDTGRSRAGWSAGAKFVGIRMPGGSSAAVLEGAAKSGMTITGGDDGHIVFEVSNAVDYAPYLEDGSSQQAPIGAVEISKEELEQGAMPQRVIDAYRHLWDYLGKAPGSVEIRAADVQVAVRKANRLAPAGVIAIQESGLRAAVRRRKQRLAQARKRREAPGG